MLASTVVSVIAKEITWVDVEMDSLVVLVVVVV
jgi:hypothetical protein